MNPLRILAGALWAPVVLASVGVAVVVEFATGVSLEPVVAAADKVGNAILGKEPGDRCN